MAAPAVVRDLREYRDPVAAAPTVCAAADAFLDVLGESEHRTRVRQLTRSPESDPRATFVPGSSLVAGAPPLPRAIPVGGHLQFPGRGHLRGSHLAVEVTVRSRGSADCGYALVRLAVTRASRGVRASRSLPGGRQPFCVGGVEDFADQEVEVVGSGAVVAQAGA